MPLIRIDVPEGVSKDIKKQIHNKVREVVLKTLAPKEVKYDYVSIREAFEANVEYLDKHFNTLPKTKELMTMAKIEGSRGISVFEV